MKIRPLHFEKLKAAVSPFDTPARREQYLAGNFPRADKVKDLDMRYRWDTLYASKLAIEDCGSGANNLNLYSYMNDSHIDTALKAIIPPLK